MLGKKLRTIRSAQIQAQSKLFNGIIGLLLSLTVSSCGMLKGGAISPNNNALPTGNLLAQGQFMGSSASGTAQIYFSSGSYVLTLAGINFPEAPTTMLARVYIATPSDIVATIQLRSSAGTTNYPFSSTTGLNSFARVEVINAANNQVYTQATLTSVSTR